MDEQAAAWKNVAMNALGEGEPNAVDDGLVGVDWLAASINSREIPGGCDRRASLGNRTKMLLLSSSYLLHNRANLLMGRFYVQISLLKTSLSLLAKRL